MAQTANAHTPLVQFVVDNKSTTNRRNGVWARVDCN